jgi:hypothetical protein
MMILEFEFGLTFSFYPQGHCERIWGRCKWLANPETSKRFRHNDWEAFEESAFFLEKTLTKLIAAHRFTQKFHKHCCGWLQLDHDDNIASILVRVPDEMSIVEEHAAQLSDKVVISEHI